VSKEENDGEFIDNGRKEKRRKEKRAGAQAPAL
jgi:hypothetical protein